MADDHTEIANFHSTCLLSKSWKDLKRQFAAISGQQEMLI